ncbi:hypothetical protein KC352_g1491 [Hortaea werneckii]|nr:hypothetical protein KC358_g5319 [Hortaea werneckii]KAI6937157.1 hypothetical protein KC348_g5834 [Hortaea werneckii]KAI6937641.1 hypothetical protein KC341_g5445 [Hortaea werneckii]KAI6969460.1 hypothetical protein KC321_g7883 [Hortaea werneckii]KAI7039678.1 hypothetical protein KC362_g5709 [Hortaea werneckii]
MPPATSSFINLPPELRNLFYEHVFQNTAPETKDLFSSKAPGSGLVATNRLLRSETKPIYEDIYKSFWRSHTFTVEIDFFAGDRITYRAAMISRCKKLGNVPVMRVIVETNWVHESRSARLFTQYSHPDELKVWITTGEKKPYERSAKVSEPHIIQSDDQSCLDVKKLVKWELNTLLTFPLRGYKKKEYAQLRALGAS